MNCDTFLADVETGGVIRRIRARRHASRCQRCAAACAALGEAKRQLAAFPPLAPDFRRLWEQAIDDIAMPVPRRRRQNIGLAAVSVMSAACLLLLMYGPAIKQPDPDPLPSPVPELNVSAPVPTAMSTVVTREINVAEELSDLAAAVERLDGELAELRKLAERRDAERQIALVLKRFENW